MTLEELYEFAENWEPTDEEIEKFSKMLKDFDDKLCEDARLSRVDDTLLNKRYNM